MTAPRASRDGSLTMLGGNMPLRIIFIFFGSMVAGFTVTWLILFGPRRPR
jgi:hypothetical protein